MIVTNMTNQMLTLYAHDGASVSLPAKASKAKVADKYGWQIPKGVHVHVAPAPSAVELREEVVVEAPPMFNSQHDE